MHAHKSISCSIYRSPEIGRYKVGLYLRVRVNPTIIHKRDLITVVIFIGSYRNPRIFSIYMCLYNMG